MNTLDGGRCTWVFTTNVAKCNRENVELKVKPAVSVSDCICEAVALLVIFFLFFAVATFSCVEAEHENFVLFNCC